MKKLLKLSLSIVVAGVVATTVNELQLASVAFEFVTMGSPSVMLPPS
ncbi:hypothetical protein [Alkalicoccobacillus gibsonii]|nr:hypothetical protein [Alkalicoccobacillus gibsonii]MBM0066623.1 hypothetical protein [Alkalicoccobacillus gibsonii]